MSQDKPQTPPQVPVAPAAESSGIDGMIPYKNVPALLSYYFGVFAFIPCLGFVLMFPAIILGILGLIRASKHPGAKGKGHAWAGIICGVIGPWVVLLILFLVMGGK